MNQIIKLNHQSIECERIKLKEKKSSMDKLKKKVNKGPKKKEIVFFNKELPFHLTFNFDSLTFNPLQTMNLDSSLQNKKTKSIP
jgi:hypothetical protein